MPWLRGARHVNLVKPKLKLAIMQSVDDVGVLVLPVLDQSRDFVVQDYT